MAALLLVALCAVPPGLADAQAAPRAPARPAAPPAPAPPPPQAFLAATIADVGRPYTVVDTACVFQPFPKASTDSDPLEQSMAEAFRRVRKIVSDAGANGFVGYDIDFASPVGREPGRLLLCGTLVRFR